MAAPAETRTPNLRRAKRFAPRECEWKHGDSGYSARRKPCRTKTQTNSLDSDRPSHGRRITPSIWCNGDIATVDGRLSPVALAARRVILKRAAPQHLSDKMSAGNELLR